ncbi:transposable element Tc1 transposase, partial [Trichonephila clavipes]
ISCAAEQFHIHGSLEAVDRRTPSNSKSGSGQWMRTSEGDDRHLIRIALNDRTASPGQLAAHWTIATGVLMSASSIRRRLLHRRLLARVPLSRIPLTPKHQWLRLPWDSELRSWQVVWHQVVFSDEPRFSLWDYEGRFRVRRYAVF